MSRFVSLAFAQLQLANVALEDLLIAELDGGIGDIEPIELQLSASQDSLAKLLQTTEELQDEMSQQGFKDLLTIHPVNLLTTGEALVRAGMTTERAWNDVAQNARSNGFWKNLACIQGLCKDLVVLTANLAAKVADLQVAAVQGDVASVLEENRCGNLKPEFARLFSAWHNFQDMFLASALLSTEVYYSFNGFGSLVDSAAQTSVA